MVVADARPQAINVPFRPGNTLTATITWPAGELTGRTFVSTLGGVALSLDVVDDVMTIEATEAQTTAVTTAATWLLTETTGGASNDLLIGTWAPSNDPGAATAIALTVTAGGIEVTVSVVSGQSSIVALAARQGQVVTWRDADAWDRFDETPVSNPGDSTPVLTVDDGFGVATHGTPQAGGNDRRIYYLEHTDGIRNAEVYLDWEIAAGACQSGIALRGDDGVAVMVWSNIFFAATVNLLQGCWEFNGTDLLDTNQDAGSIGGFPIPVASASGDGTTVTVRTVVPHGNDSGDLVSLIGVGSFGNVTVAAVPTATSLTFASSTSGSWTGGTVGPVFAPGRRKVGVRLIGNEITFKQWLPAIQDEPAWDDPDYAETNTLPATLDASGDPPPTSGKIGVLVAHLSGDGVLRVNDLKVTNLDPLGDQIPAPVVTDDTATRNELGAQIARIDDLTPHRAGTDTPADHGIKAWTYDPAFVAAGTLLTNGTVTLARIHIREPVTVSTIYWWVTAVAATPTAGQNFVGLYSAAGTRLATTNVDAVITSTGLKSTAITPVALVPGFYWVAWVSQAATAPTLARGTAVTGGTNVINLGLATAALRAATNASGQTSLPATINPASNTANFAAFWAALG